MKFKDYDYIRPDMAVLKASFNVLLASFTAADTFEIQDSIMTVINKIRADFESMTDICGIRNTIDTTDTFYENEQAFFDKNLPVYAGLVTDYYKVLVSSIYEPQLRDKWGNQLFDLATLSIKTFDPVILEDLQEENKLVTMYRKLIASAKIPFEGEERTLTQLTPFTKSKDRSIRKAAFEAISGFMSTNEATIDDIYDKLVKLRAGMATKLGYDSFVALGYDRLSRTDYDAAKVANFRKQVETYIVPIATKLRQEQAQRLDLEALTYYDEPFEFKTGNAVPKGNPEWIIQNGVTMYSELSEETKEFFNFMVDHELLDLVSKKGKAGGGYCTYIPNYSSPFIFSNFNGTSGDIDVLTHEAGHAFQVYLSRDFKVPEYTWPTFEACEVHSMSMEFFTWPWMDLFFKEDADKYRYTHLSSALEFIPYGVSVDEFQHYVYENPEATPSERKAAWRSIEKKYLPHRDYADNDFFEKGTFWYRQSHIFGTPFYYIDYTLAQLCAFQFFKWMQENKEETWHQYVKLCKLGGSKPFVELITSVGLKSPFESGTVESVVDVIKDWLEEFDKSHTLT
ncbi:MAG: M3 family oligoendopeptidase [Vallitaleaceae bacterium]|jgi:M3 family oligoendopeptidase|nr:M3 family oligoendopeptidase [Vallitaleaceae bacterium]